MKPENKNKNKKDKKKYQAPKVKSENLMVYGALCNGMTGGGRKGTISSGCSSSKLRS